ncbi:Fcf2 pre-rRNA processing-domain-containing protein [Halteromyces radiatus]|uniref:Fcf2 pre-rRNA processing-domain-containing protein n=1 Tax=Halteromyces radiatus TaxID=101107 RepID=UPI00221E3AFA|nr:Fcf2 pre-rRNA processing-domain-containing protein [Halteromyces radiatus]KAI8081708.1 Fcf2 pre-rRNA processing-domain-containing protein [Halteromyces radiatus]
MVTTRRSANLNGITTEMSTDLNVIKNKKPNSVASTKRKNSPVVVPHFESDSSSEKEDDEDQVEQESDDNDDSDDSDDSSSNDDSDDQDEEDNNDDLDDLLEKAQAALRVQQDNMIKLDKDDMDKTDIKLPKLQPGVSVEQELYIGEEAGVAKLSTQVVALVDSEEAADQVRNNNKTLIALKKNNVDTKSLTRKERQQEREKTAGKGWFDMPLVDMTPEIKRDLQILKMRHVLDRKRHYKKMGKNELNSKYFQMGTIIEGATEFFSSRINRKDRRQTIADELMADMEQQDYYKRKYVEAQDRHTSGGKSHYKKVKAKRY